jgi:hypothetical protein
VKDLDLDLDFELVIREIFFPILNFNFGWFKLFELKSENCLKFMSHLFCL